MIRYLTGFAIFALITFFLLWIFNKWWNKLTADEEYRNSVWTRLMMYIAAMSFMLVALPMAAYEIANSLNLIGKYPIGDVLFFMWEGNSIVFDEFLAWKSMPESTQQHLVPGNIYPYVRSAVTPWLIVLYYGFFELPFITVDDKWIKLFGWGTTRKLSGVEKAINWIFRTVVLFMPFMLLLRWIDSWEVFSSLYNPIEMANGQVPIQLQIAHEVCPQWVFWLSSVQTPIAEMQAQAEQVTGAQQTDFSWLPWVLGIVLLLGVFYLIWSRVRGNKKSKDDSLNLTAEQQKEASDLYDQLKALADTGSLRSPKGITISRSIQPYVKAIGVQFGEDVAGDIQNWIAIANGQVVEPTPVEEEKTGQQTQNAAAPPPLPATASSDELNEMYKAVTGMTTAQRNDTAGLGLIQTMYNNLNEFNNVQQQLVEIWYNTFIKKEQ